MRGLAGIEPAGTAPADRDDAAWVAGLLDQLARLSEPGPGVTRLAYTPLEREAHDLFASWMRELGLEVHVDPAGNTLAELPGTGAGLPAIGTGSHLDSVPGGGRFDGIVGVVSAVAVARGLVEQGARPVHPIRFVAFAGEEGARFGQACLGSRLAAGLTRESELYERRDIRGVTLAEAMTSVGLDPRQAVRRPWQPSDWAAFVELHVEQGSVLECAGIAIGLVDLISGSSRLSLELQGQASHTGATPMAHRADALAAAAEIVLHAEDLATDAQHRGTRATVGRLEVHPGSITTIPGLVRMAVDIRDVDSDRQRTTAAELVRRARTVCDRRRIQLSIELLGDASPVVLPAWLREVLAEATRAAGVAYRPITSGASHDSQMINHIMPAGMIFVPSKDGLSHVPEEWTKASDIVTGVDVLTRSLLLLDEELASRGPRATT
ncbi:Zn-dependent hydrolase [Nocardioides hungaricus]